MEDVDSRGVSSGAIVILVLAFGPRLVVLAPVVVSVAWAQVALDDQTPAPVTADAVIGAIVAAVVFEPLR